MVFKVGENGGEWVGERRAVRPTRRICNNPGEGMATWTNESAEKWSVLDML